MGGDAAHGDWLLFLHADTRLGTGWRAAVAAHAAAAPEFAGCFGLRLDDAAWQARLIERGVELRVRLLGLPYGDQGLLISRRLYDEAGGFRPLALMEDVDLVCRIGRPAAESMHGETSAVAAAGWRGDRRENIACRSTFWGWPARIARRR